MFYITKYATSQGIFVIRGKTCTYNRDNGDVRTYVSNEDVGAGSNAAPRVFCRLGKDAFRTLKEARNDAQTRLENKVAALKKQIKKLESKRLTIHAVSKSYAE
jgi:hypothetical protein